MYRTVQLRETESNGLRDRRVKGSLTASVRSVARDRGWFAEYTPFESHLNNNYGLGGGSAVKGIGTVILPVRTKSKGSGPRCHGTLRLQNVLHAPSVICNIIGSPIFFDDIAEVIEYRTGSIRDKLGRQIAYLVKDSVCPNVSHVKLSGPPLGPQLGPSPFNQNDVYMISVRWSDAERAKWERAKPYTDEEKQWLKDHWNGEFNFLRAYGFSIYKDEDREEGRAIVRTFMSNDSQDQDLDAGDIFEHTGFCVEVEDLDENEDDEEDMEDMLEGHQADYNFTDCQLEFVEKHWDNAVNFMHTYGLKFYDDDDCNTARRLVDKLIKDAA